MTILSMYPDVSCFHITALSLVFPNLSINLAMIP